MGRPAYWNDQTAAEAAKGYKFKVDFSNDYPGAYGYLKNKNKKLLNELFPNFKKRLWYKDTIAEEALKYSNKKDFRVFSNGAYCKASELGVIDEVCRHMKNSRLKDDRLDLGKLTGMSGIYMLYDKSKLVYIGRSSSCVVSRIRDHYKTKDFDSIEIHRIKNQADILLIEHYLIAKYKPFYNSEYVTPDRLTIEIIGIDDLIGNPISVGVNGLNAHKGK